jgi:endonuclease/exonuclease/phosphatase (EEP) superfamily protein YafD
MKAYQRVVTSAAVIAALLTAVSWLGSYGWAPELLTHFRVQFVAGALAIGTLAVAVRRPGVALVAVLTAAANAWPMLPYLVPGALPVQASERSVRMMFANVNINNDHYDTLRALVEAEQPDILGLAEVDERWLTALSALHSEFPYSVLRPQADAHGLALFSRLPLRELHSAMDVQEGVQLAIVAEAELANGRVTVIVAHPMSPISPGSAAARNMQLRSISGMIKADRNHGQILIGDLNTTPWSPHYASLETDANLVNAARGRGYWPTWPAWTPEWGVFKIPIDHCLLSDGIEVQQFRTGPEIGSDHLPLIVDVAIPARSLATVNPDAG